jgi:hypothetical protein
MPLHQSKKKALLFYWAVDGGPQTVTEQIHALTSIPGYEFDLFNLHYDSPGNRKPLQKISALLKKRSLKDYSVILFHSTASYNIDNLEKSFQFFAEDMANTEAKKILFKQDEMIDVNKTKNFVKNYNIHVLFTCIPEREIHKVYPKQEFPNLQFYHMLTGYLTEELIYRKNKPYEQRNIDISYRGMKPPYEWGRLSYEKYQIAEEFLKKAKEHNLQLNLDISTSTQDRIGKTDWYKFLENSKSCLAVESGASIFDFDGSVKAKCDQYCQTHPDASFVDVYQKILLPYENNVSYNQISPRHLEAAAMETALIMYEGEYSGLFLPHKNFIPLKKDFSNFLEVIEICKNERTIKELTLNNKRLIKSDQSFHYSFFQTIIERHFNS